MLYSTAWVWWHGRGYFCIFCQMAAGWTGSGWGGARDTFRYPLGSCLMPACDISSQDTFYCSSVDENLARKYSLPQVPYCKSKLCDKVFRDTSVSLVHMTAVAESLATFHFKLRRPSWREGCREKNKKTKKRKSRSKNRPSWAPTTADPHPHLHWHCKEKKKKKKLNIQQRQQRPVRPTCALPTSFFSRCVLYWVCHPSPRRTNFPECRAAKKQDMRKCQILSPDSLT